MAKKIGEEGVRGNVDEAQEWLDEYDSIYRDYLAQIESSGVTLSSEGADEVDAQTLLARVAAKGAQVRNGGASVCVNGLSTACVACTGDPGSQTFFYSLACPRNCYFCFNCNQQDYTFYLSHDRDWLAEMNEIERARRTLTHVGLTGGEPLLHPEKAQAFFTEARRRWPKAHLRLYTSGWGLDDALLERLVEAGLDEIRFSVKLDEGQASYDEVLTHVQRAASIAGLDAMVEMPVIPGTLDAMKQLLRDLDTVGAFGINLLEFCYPQGSWDEFGRRGFEVRNPPFPVLYNWAYAGGLPIRGSELDCLRLVEFALDEELSLSVHYCSLENKHRDQVLSQNRMIEFNHPSYEMDPNDFYYKTVKAFGKTAQALKRRLERRRARGWDYDSSDGSLTLAPALAKSLVDNNVPLYVSFNILESRDGSVFLRELALKRYSADQLQRSV